MTPTEIDNIPVGPELDAACAEAMGMKFIDGAIEVIGSRKDDGFAPSANIADAWKLVDSVAALDNFELSCPMIRHEMPKRRARFYGVEGIGKTAQEAICRAFLHRANTMKPFGNWRDAIGCVTRIPPPP